jgi:hypothetical protein
MGLVAAVLTAIGLAACAGLRAFMPLFAAGLGARLLDLRLADSVGWLASDTAIIIFGVATAIELLADKIPVVDNALDVVQTVAAPVAGGMVAFAPMVDLDAPWLAALAIMTGAAVAGGIHAAAATTRVKSTALSAGAANPVLSVIEDVLAVGSVLAALLLPLLILLVLIAFALWIRWLRRRQRPGATAGP